jgi:hypothetical protein
MMDGNGAMGVVAIAIVAGRRRDGQRRRRRRAGGGGGRPPPGAGGWGFGLGRGGRRPPPPPHNHHLASLPCHAPPLPHLPPNCAYSPLLRNSAPTPTLHHCIAPSPRQGVFPRKPVFLVLLYVLYSLSFETNRLRERCMTFDFVHVLRKSTNHGHHTTDMTFFFSWYIISYIFL